MEILLFIAVLSFIIFFVYQSIVARIRDTIRQAIYKKEKEIVADVQSFIGSEYWIYDMKSAKKAFREYLEKREGPLRRELIFRYYTKEKKLKLEFEKKQKELMLNYEKKYIEKCKQIEFQYKDREEKCCLIEQLIKTKSAKFPPLARAFEKIDLLPFYNSEQHLLCKNRPAVRAALEIREARKQAKLFCVKFHAAKNLIDSYEALFPWLEEYRTFDLEEVVQQSENNHDEDPVRNYIPDIEYEKMTPCERNQKALERYRESHKSNVQIGRLYERYIGYEYESKGYEISYYGALYGLEDLGRDLIAKKRGEILIIQCKYWSKEKRIRENAICQLYGTTIKYRLDHPGEKKIKAVMVTSTICSDVAHKFAEFLGVEIIEKKLYKNYPMIKCNISKDGEKIYHLPFDQQYDKIKIEPNKGEFYAETCMEAELNSFRRAWRWRGG